MMRKVDESPALIRLLNRTSSLFARRRGQPVVIGIVMIALSMILALINISAASTALETAQVLLHHVGLIVALVGLLLSQPLGN